MDILVIKDLRVKAGEKIILDGISLTVAKGENLVIMGPNGSGKSTLAKVIMGHPDYEIVSGSIIFLGREIIDLKPEERAAAGIFLSFQEPRSIAGLDLFPFLFDAHRSLSEARGTEADSVFAFKEKVEKELAYLGINGDWSKRQLNQDFSGGEKKKSELLQLALSGSSLAVLDEIDAGLDIDALSAAGRAFSRFKDGGGSLLVITHYRRALEVLKPDRIIIMSHGKIVAVGGLDVAERLEKEGFSSFI